MRCLLCEFFLLVRKAISNIKDYEANIFLVLELPSGSKNPGILEELFISFHGLFSLESPYLAMLC